MYGKKKTFRSAVSGYADSRRALSKVRASTYRKDAASDQRQLASVVRKARSANPYQITPASGRTVTFWRKTQISYTLNQLSGFQSAGNNVNFGFSLGRLIGYTSGVFQISQAMPNAAEFQALFDYYKVSAVKMQIFFSKNTDPMSTSTGLSHGMPLLLICNDFDDISESMTRDSMMERVGCRHVQFDSNNVNGICHYIKPKPSNVVVETNTSTGALTSVPAGVEFGSQWLDCATNNVVHNGIKVYYDNQGITSSVTLGQITFVFDVCYEFKGYR